MQGEIFCGGGGFEKSRLGFWKEVWRKSGDGSQFI